MPRRVVAVMSRLHPTHPKPRGAVVGFVIAAMVFAAFALMRPLALLSGTTFVEGVSCSVALSYGRGARQVLDVCVAQGKSGKAPPASASMQVEGQVGGRPVVVFFYGGSWNRGERGDYRFAALTLARRGAVVVIPDYRLYPEVRYPDFLEDSAQAVAWALRHAAEFGGDPRRVVVMGHSAGAYNAAMVALDPRWLRLTGHRPEELAGFIGLAGPYNFLPIRNPEVKPVFRWPQTPPDTQPLAHVNGRAPAALLIAPLEDVVVDPDRNTEMLAQALRAACVPVTVKRYGALNHSTSVAALAPLLSWLAPVTEDVVTFVLQGRRESTGPPCSSAASSQR